MRREEKRHIGKNFRAQRIEERFRIHSAERGGESFKDLSGDSRYFGILRRREGIAQKRDSEIVISR